MQRDPYIIRRWFEGGVVIQLNKGSILGRLGRRAQDTALWLLERGPPGELPNRLAVCYNTAIG